VHFSRTRGCDAGVGWLQEVQKRSFAKLRQQQATPQFSQKVEKGINLPPALGQKPASEGHGKRAIGQFGCRSYQDHCGTPRNDMHAIEWAPPSSAQVQTRPEFPGQRALVVSTPSSVQLATPPAELHSDSPTADFVTRQKRWAILNFKAPAMPFGTQGSRKKPSCLEREIQESTQDRHGTSIRQNPCTMSIRRVPTCGGWEYTGLRRRPLRFSTL